MRSPIKLTPELMGTLCEAISHGLSDKQAAALCGISPSTLKDWRRQAKTAEPHSNLRKLDKMLERADAEFLFFHAKAFRDCDKPGLWQKHAWALERRDPERFALVQKTEIKTPAGRFEGMDDPELNASILEMIPRKRARTGDVGARKVPKGWKPTESSSLAPENGAGVTGPN